MIEMNRLSSQSGKILNPKDPSDLLKGLKVILQDCL